MLSAHQTDVPLYQKHLYMSWERQLLSLPVGGLVAHPVGFQAQDRLCCPRKNRADVRAEMLIYLLEII
jgi:hypothetical protein